MVNNISILLVDDEKEYLDALKLVLKANDFNSYSASSGEEALTLIDKIKVDLVITDFKMKGIDGLELLERIKSSNPDIEVIVITGYGDVQNAVEAMKMGAYAYFVKSHDPDELIMEIIKIQKMINYKNKANLAFGGNYFLDSQNTKFKEALDLATRVADSNSNVLLLGESGVGKEVFANFIHGLSSRKDNPFIPVNCHTFSETLLQSELYGHEKGSFTGATEKRIGRFEASHGGTLFLDEIGDTSLDVQLNLLRVLDTKKIERVGANELIDVDFRLICATNKSIKDKIANKTFREDFYYRISTIVIEIPPLRERQEDIKGIIEFFIKKYSNDMKKDITKVEDEAMDYLLGYHYPGNIRELKNIIERLVVLARGNEIKALDISEEIKGTSKKAILLKDVRSIAEKNHIERIYMLNDYNMTKTASILGISRRQLFNKIEEYRISK